MIFFARGAWLNNQMRFESEEDPCVQVGFSEQVDVVARLVANYSDDAVRSEMLEEA